MAPDEDDLIPSILCDVQDNSIPWGVLICHMYLVAQSLGQFLSWGYSISEFDVLTYMGMSWACDRLYLQQFYILMGLKTPRKRPNGLK